MLAVFAVSTLSMDPMNVSIDAQTATRNPLNLYQSRCVSTNACGSRLEE